jgi:hypothetical protein
MEKMAIFVEGQTEQVFAEELVCQIAGRRRVHVDAVRAHGGNLIPRTFLEVHASRPDPAKEYYVVIYDSSNDSRVLSDIRESYESLVAQGFREIVGIRDVYPQAPADIPTIRSDFMTYAPTGRVTALLVLAIMEIEAWFIAEHTHFAKISAALTLTAVTTALGYDASTHDVQTIPHPAEELRRAYMVAGRGYNKSRRHVERTARVLDYLSFYTAIRARIPDLDVLISSIERFLS